VFMEWFCLEMVLLDGVYGMYGCFGYDDTSSRKPEVIMGYGVTWTEKPLHMCMLVRMSPGNGMKNVFCI